MRRSLVLLGLVGLFAATRVLAADGISDIASSSPTDGRSSHRTRRFSEEAS
jgi:hypothetical protein